MTARRSRIRRPLWLLVSWFAIGAVLAVLVATAFPFAVGGRPYVVRSGSMTPAIDTGDVVAVEKISPLEAEVGDIVTFEDPEGRLISHRARAINERGKRIAFVTQGDANTTKEHWGVPVDGTIGRVIYRVPKLGFAAGPISSPAGRIGLLAVPALLLAVSLLTRIWRSGPREETDGAHA